MSTGTENKNHHAVPDERDANKLAARVARRRVEAAARENPSERVLFSIAGLTPAQVSEIAREIDKTIEGAQVYIHPSLNDGTLPNRVQSEKTATHWRNTRQPDGVGPLVFAVPDEERETTGASIANIVTIDTTTLIENADAWIEESRFPFGDAEKIRMGHVLSGLRKTDLIRDLGFFSRFVVRVCAALNDVPMATAIDRSLPELRIPLESGRFREQRLKSYTAGKWQTEFERIDSEIRDKLYLRDSKGAPLNRDDLRTQVDELEADEKIPSKVATAVRHFLDDNLIAAGEWRPTQARLVELPWNDVEKIFVNTKTKQQKVPLGEETQNFLEHRYPEMLTQEQRQTLADLNEQTSGSTSDEREFFYANRETLRKESRKLYNRWERYIFQKPIIRSEILSGLLLALRTALQATDETAPASPIVYVQLNGSKAPIFWLDQKNSVVCRYLRDTMRGLAEIGAPDILIDLGVCWSETVSEKLDVADVTSVSAQATEFKFEVYVLSPGDFDDDGCPRREALRNAPKGQFRWKMSPESLPAQLPADLRSILPDTARTAHLIAPTFARNPQSHVAKTARVTLGDANSMLDAADRSDGQLANPDKSDLNVTTRFTDALEALERDHVVSNRDAKEIRRAFTRFNEVYTQAMYALTRAKGRGIADPAILNQAEAFADLLRLLRTRLRAQQAREKVWYPLLSIGIAVSTDRPAAAIVTSWNPLRLAERAAKSHQFIGLCRKILANDLQAVAARDEYFYDRAASLDTYHYPGAVGHIRFGKKVLASEESLGGYTLMEPQTVEQGAETRYYADPSEAANSFLRVCDEYLNLKPHEQSNFSCILYNSESRGLPGALSELLARKIDGEPRLRCDLTLTHDDPSRLRVIYAEQNAEIGYEIDSALSSEAAKSFLSRLRVGFNHLDAVRDAHDGLGHSSDLVLLQDVIARNALSGWRRLLSDPTPLSLRDFDPSSVSKRCPRDPSRGSSATYLIPPQNPAEVQSYVDLLHDYLEGDETEGTYSWVPVREVLYDNQLVTRALQSSHQLGEWVVNYDVIADRHLLEENESDIRIIRHLSGPSSEHNLIVSSRTPGRHLRYKLLGEVRPLVPSLSEDALNDLVDKLIDQASRISGQIVMRAARHERNAQELIGLVLSKILIRDALGKREPELAWFFLDDIGAWLGHSPGRVADIFALSPTIINGRRTLDFVVAESKFVNESGHADQMKKSSNQLLSTIQQISDRFFGTADQIDDGMWRARLADLMVEHLRFFGDEKPQTLADWADGLRNSQLDIRLRGRSYTFVHDMAPPASVEVQELREGETQILIPRDEVTNLLLRLTGRGQAQPSPEAQSLNNFVSSVRASQKTENIERSAEPDTKTNGDLRLMVQNEGLLGADHTSGSHSETDANITGTVKDYTRNGQTEDVGNYNNNCPLSATGALPGPVRDLIENRPIKPLDANARAWLDDTVNRLRIALRDYSMDCKVIDQRLTPNAALIRLEGSNRLTPRQILKKQEELEVSHRLTLLKVLSAPGEVIVMIKRENRDFPTILEVWSQRALPETAPVSNTSFLIGLREDTGGPLYLNFATEFAGQCEHNPHTLIAGMTGGGKGVLVQNILLDICATNAPSAARVWIIDPKQGLDYTWIEGMPHLATEMATTKKAAALALTSLIDEMNRRFTLFSKTEGYPQKIDEYNALVPESDRIPRIYVFHDEFAFWGQDKEYRRLAEQHINGLGQMARAAGIHVILITQRPDKDVMPIQARENLGNRLALRVANENNANLIGVPGSDDLLPKGQLAASLPGEDEVIYAQVPNVTQHDLGKMADAIRTFWENQQEPLRVE